MSRTESSVPTILVLRQDIYAGFLITEKPIYGTDREFEEVTSRPPKLTSQILEECTTKLFASLPPGNWPWDFLELAAVCFNYGLCHSSLVRGTDALQHECMLMRESYRRIDPHLA